MSARRTPSTTSLSRSAHGDSPSMQNRSFDFCNAFWGLGDGGVDVLFARMRGAARTMEELKNFWKERAVIEEDYGKRLAKLGKMVLGRDEIGELKNSLDTIRSETDRQATFHLNLAQQIRTELEAPVTSFHSRQLQHKKTYQATVEKEFKAKQTQESYVNKAREKYEQDCLRINSFTAQASLVQGKDLEKINLKLERTHQTVQTNEREFANLAKVLQDTVQKWEQDWRRFCDSCQDLEDQRMEFMKDNLWAYANAVSTVCVADDESCERVRLSLEQMEPDREMEFFVRDYGTGSQIPDPPAFVNYQLPDAVPSSSARPTFRNANFIRSTSRESPIRQSLMFVEEPIINAAGIGAGGGHRRTDSHGPDGGEAFRQNTVISTSQNNHMAYTNGISGHQHNQSQSSNSPAASSPSAVTRRQSMMQPPASQQPRVLQDQSNLPITSSPAQVSRRPTVMPTQTPQQQLHRVLQDPYAEPVDPTADTYIRVGPNAYKVDPMNDPQQATPSSNRTGTALSSTEPSVGSETDPLMRQLEELRNAVSTTGSVRRNTVIKPKINTDPKPTHSASSSISNLNRKGTIGSSLSPPGSAVAGGAANRSPSPGRDFRNSAEVVVGAHPSASRSPSPNPPTAAFMVPKSATPAGSEPVQEIVAGYQQSLPGERKSISRSNSRTGQNSVGSSAGPSQKQQQGQNLVQPVTPAGHAGVGAHGGSRSSSPQPTISRGPSPRPGELVNRDSFIQPPLQTGAGISRAPSPNTVGIALDPSGRVLHDEMAQRYQQQRSSAQSQLPMQQGRMGPAQVQQPTYNAPPPQPSPLQTQRKNYLASPGTQPYVPISPPPSSGVYHNTTPSPQPGYAPPQATVAAAGATPLYNPPTPAQYQPLQQQQPRYVQQQPPPQQQAPPPQMNTYGSVNNMDSQQRPTVVGYQTSPQQPTQQIAAAPTTQMLNIQQQAQVIRSVSPQQPQQKTEDGLPVLFYVRALFDYAATIDEEFDFQAGDIIAVTSTPEDGWWTGELLDEARRQHGRNVFPSNFVTFF